MQADVTARADGTLTSKQAAICFDHSQWPQHTPAAFAS
jgi:hypothetical protein